MNVSILTIQEYIGSIQEEMEGSRAVDRRTYLLDERPLRAALSKTTTVVCTQDDIVWNPKKGVWNPRKINPNWVVLASPATVPGASSLTPFSAPASPNSNWGWHP